MQDHAAVRIVGLATSEAAAACAAGAQEEACSISAVDDNRVSSGGCKDDVSGAVREEVCVSLLMVVGTFLAVYTVRP